MSKPVWERPEAITPRRMLLELTGKHALIVLVFLLMYRPLCRKLMSDMPLDAQGPVIELLGFLMAAAIIGAFELSYARTNLADGPQRLIAHFTKFTLYSSILLLMDVAVNAMRPSGHALVEVTVMAATPVALALVAYDFWDALRALDNHHPR